MRASAILAVAIGLALACDTGAHEGEYCKDTWPQCQDDHTALWCDNGVFRPFSCPGPDGCRTTTYGGQVVNSCDVEGTKAGDRCISVYAGFIMCRYDGNTALKCNGTNWVDVECTTGYCENGESSIGKVDSRGSCK